MTMLVKDADLPETNAFAYEILNDSFFASQFAVKANVDGSGALIATASLNLTALRAHEDGIKLTIYVSDNGVFTERDHTDSAKIYIKCDKSDDQSRFPAQLNKSVSSEVRRQFHIGSEPRRIDYEFEPPQLTSTEFSHPTDLFLFPNKCHNSPCQNGATCINFANGNFLCVCVNGYSGALCDIENARNVNYKMFNPLSLTFLGSFTYYVIGFAILVLFLLPIIYCVIFHKSNVRQRAANAAPTSTEVSAITSYNQPNDKEYQTEDFSAINYASNSAANKTLAISSVNDCYDLVMKELHAQGGSVNLLNESNELVVVKCDSCCVDELPDIIIKSSAFNPSTAFEYQTQQEQIFIADISDDVARTSMPPSMPSPSDSARSGDTKTMHVQILDCQHLPFQ